MTNASLICTTLNEEKSIGDLIDSIFVQSIKPSEIIIVDGGSIDATAKVINNKIKQYSKDLNIKLFIKKGNRSIGRNEAVKQSSNPIILITDAGCILDKNWVKIIIKPFEEKSTEVVAGFYKGKANNIFQKALIPYTLVMEDKVNENDFLPATRSMAIAKKVFLKLKGFNESLSNNEDYEFANRLKASGSKIVFVKDALVFWKPRSDIRQAYNMFWRFAYGDIEAGIIRPKVAFIFLRYFSAIYLIMLCFIMRSTALNIFTIVSGVAYVIWAVIKNYKYVKDPRGFFYLPLLQVTSDFAVISGSGKSFLKKIKLKSIYEYFLQNKSLTIILGIYIVSLLSTINWGIPNVYHPFNYFMDEWHQSQSVRNLFKFGSPNIAGSANGSIFQFFLSGLYLIPFIVLGLVNPFAIKSSVTNLLQQHTLFEILRLNTLLFGVASIILFYYICKRYFKLPAIATFLFVINPIWLMLSNYFKYDIALMFWILVSLLFFLKYAKKPNNLDFLLGAFFSAIALSVKLSPFALPIVFALEYFIFTKNIWKNFRLLLSGIILYISAFLLFGIPDVILGKGSLTEYLVSNLGRTPLAHLANTNLSTGVWQYLFTDLYPVIFGHVFYIGFLITSVICFIFLIKSIFKKDLNKSLLIIFLCLLFSAMTLYPLKLDATNNRALVLLPFMAIIFSQGLYYFIETIKKQKIRIVIISIMGIFLFVQVLESFSWIYIKLSQDPRQSSSAWISKNIARGSSIGIENIPIYQELPDLIIYDFYQNQYNKSYKTNYKYTILSRSSIIPKYVILTNEDIDLKYSKISEKNDLVSRMNNKYNKIARFTPNFKYLDLFSNTFDYFITGIVQEPVDLTIYEKK